MSNHFAADSVPRLPVGTPVTQEYLDWASRLDFLIKECKGSCVEAYGIRVKMHNYRNRTGEYKYPSVNQSVLYANEQWIKDLVEIRRSLAALRERMPNMPVAVGELDLGNAMRSVCGDLLMIEKQFQKNQSLAAK